MHPFLLLLPGLLCDDVVWRDQVNALSTKVDSTIADFSSFSSLTDMAEAALELAPKRFNLAGHSMGGRVALEILRLAPERVDKLALLDTGVHPRRKGEAKKRRELVDLAYADGMGALADVWLPPMVHPDRHDDALLMGMLRDMVLRATPDQFARQVTALLNRPDASAQVADIRCPTLVACGRQDAWSPLEQHQMIAQVIPHARLEVIENSGHMSTVEKPDAVTDALLRWLDVGKAKN